jgi:hypothetical protein
MKNILIILIVLGVISGAYWYFIYEYMYPIWYYNHYLTWLEEFRTGVVPVVIHHIVLAGLVRCLISDLTLNIFLFIGLTILPFELIGW